MYKAARPCRFGGRQFYAGDEIPEELIDPNRVKALTKYGTIAYVPEPPESPPEAPASEGDTNTRQEAGNGKKGDKQTLNNATSTNAAKNTAKNTAKKGGK